MTITEQEVRNAIDFMIEDGTIPGDFEECHYNYLDEAIDNVNLSEPGFTREDIIQEVIDWCFNLEDWAFNRAMENIFDAEGVTFDEDGAEADTDLYTAEHADELKNERIEQEQLAEMERDDYYGW